MDKITEEIFQKVYNESRQKTLSEFQKFEETTPQDLRIILQKYFNDNQAAFDKNGVGKARQKVKLKRILALNMIKLGSLYH